MATQTASVSATSGTWTASAVQRGRVKKVTLTWVSTAGGAAVGVLSNMYGLLRRVSMVPDGGGTVPSNNYTLVIKDNGAPLHTVANADTVGNEFSVAIADDGATSWHSPLVLGSLTLTIAAAGNAKGGTIILYFDTLERE